MQNINVECIVYAESNISHEYAFFLLQRKEKDRQKTEKKKKEDQSAIKEQEV